MPTDISASLSTSLHVATGMSSYAMESYKLDNLKDAIYMADVDCDEGNGPIYRAASTCNVAVTFLPDGRFLYGNFTLENHVSGKKTISKDDVIQLWKSLRPDR
ncbi:hypothetical protein [Cupriavidus gilardii]|uniref:hypothetical protein n=1 Tax=Cupriavidus gilardii TaxID=82541 RepID=UPI0021C06F00|nr:hypothetical protein [Cupriavidus gilardii]MCT9123126.1 hypothetical protein [Cupriavidus gilardii]